VTNPRGLRLGLWLSHLCLMGTAGATAMTSVASPAAGAALLGVAALPLLAACPGLRAGSRYTYQWLTLLMVFYVGVAIVEVLAASSRASFASAMLAAASVELVLLLTLIRRTPPAESRE